MRSIYTVPHGAVLIRTPSARRQAFRRRLAVLAAILGLALVSAFVGSRIQPANAPATGPFSYFPS